MWQCPHAVRSHRYQDTWAQDLLEELQELSSRPQAPDGGEGEDELHTEEEEQDLLPAPVPLAVSRSHTSPLSPVPEEDSDQERDDADPLTSTQPDLAAAAKGENPVGTTHLTPCRAVALLTRTAPLQPRHRPRSHPALPLNWSGRTASFRFEPVLLLSALTGGGLELTGGGSLH